MKIEVIEEKENKLLNRKEVKATITGFEKTPTREEVRNQLVAKLGADEKKLILDEIKQEYGKKQAIVSVKIYKNEEELQKYEPKYKITRNKLLKKEKQEKEEEGKTEVKKE